MLQDEKPVNLLPSVPVGPKNNIGFVIINEVNVLRKADNMSARYWVYCGVWDANEERCIKLHYLRETLRELRFSQGQYCECKKVDGKVAQIPMSVQPKKDDVIITHRYYTKLKRDHRYQKRVSWLPHQTSGTPKAVVEYFGIFPPDVTTHGNASRCQGEYVRTRPSVLDTVAELCQTTKQKPRQLYQDLRFNANSEAEQPRNLKQIQKLGGN